MSLTTAIRWCLLLTVGLTACEPAPLAWQLTLPDAGTSAAPRTCDLNGDGVKDMVLGAGGDREWAPTPHGVVAIDGATGALLWTVPGRNQFVGSPVFLRIDADDHPDVIIGGRSAQLVAISGRTGALLWEYLPHDPAFDYRNDTTLLNFFTPQLLPDLDGDGRAEVLTAYGGYVQAAAHDPDRPAGALLIVSGATGKTLHRAPVPDGRETYLSPVLLPGPDEPQILFGTGGETLPGHLYVTPLADLFDGRLDRARTLATGREKGFIAPPLLADLTGDGWPDIVVNAYAGRTLALDGRTFAPLWELTAGPDYETHAQPAISEVDGAPECFVHFSRGAWPHSEGGRQYYIDGETGQSRIADSLGILSMASPVAAPAGRFVLVLNERRATGRPLESGHPQEAYNVRVVRFDPERGQRTLHGPTPGINLGSTPLIEDLDGDGRLELIYAFNLNPYDIKRFVGLRVVCAPFGE